MRRLITGIIAFVLLLSLAACDKQPTDPTVKPTTDTTTVSPTKPAIQTTDGKKDSLTIILRQNPALVQLFVLSRVLYFPFFKGCLTFLMRQPLWLFKSHIP